MKSKTHFASPYRKSGKELVHDIQAITDNEIMDELLRTVAGLVAVLNEHRQIISVNQAYLDYLNIQNPEDILGLRPGEVINCMYSDTMPAGCGTSSHCSTCGAAIAIVTCLAERSVVERTCAVSIDKNGVKQDLFLGVRASPVSINKKRFILLFITDLTQEQNRMNLERIFFHDISNTVGGLLNISELILDEVPEVQREDAEVLHMFVNRLVKEIELQRLLMDSGDQVLKKQLKDVSVGNVINELRNTFSLNSIMKKNRINFRNDTAGYVFKTDLVLLLRILENMVINALEASDSYPIEVIVEKQTDLLVFSVWNRKYIPPDLAKRVFQRNFSTKSDMGRGFGTFSMKMLGENILNGKVDFSSSEVDGTTFTLKLPV